MAGDHDRIGPVEIPGLLPAAGHYSHVMRGAGLLFVSGQLPIASEGEMPSAMPFEDQVHQVLTRVGDIVREAGSGQERILKVTAFIVGVERWPRFNAVYAKVFGRHRPARSVVPVSELHHGWLIEVEAVACV